MKDVKEERGMSDSSGDKPMRNEVGLIAQSVAPPQDEYFVSINDFAKSLARQMGYKGAAFGLKVVGIQNWLFTRGRDKTVRLYDDANSYPFHFDELCEPHGGLRISRTDAEQLRAEQLGETLSGGGRDKPLTRFESQEDLILAAIPAAGYEPLTTDAPKPGPALAVRVHSTKGRRTHWLEAAFKIARDQAVDPTSKMSVWQSLCGLALSSSPPEPLIGMSGKSIKRREGKGHELYGYDAFTKYWKRRETPYNAA